MKINYKTVLQVESRDCGPATIATLLNYYGKHLPISKLRMLCNTDFQGTNALDMVNALRKLSFNPKSIKVKIEDTNQILSAIQLPAIALLEGESVDHFVVIFEVNNDLIITGDPGYGTKTLKIEEFTSLSTGFLILIDYEFSDQNKLLTNATKNNYYAEIFQFILRLINNERKFFIKISLISILITIISVVSALYYRYLIDYIIPNKSNDLLLLMFMIYSLFYLLRFGADYYRRILKLKLTKSLDMKILGNLYEHLIDLPYNFFSTRKTGEITSRFSYAQNIREVISNTVNAIFLDSLLLIGSSYFLFKINKILFLLICLHSIIILWIMLSKKEMIKIYDEDLAEGDAEMQSTLIESINGYELIKSYNLQGNRKNKLIKALDYFETVGINYGAFISKRLLLQELASNIFNLIILSFGAFYVISGQLSLGNLIAFNMLKQFFSGPITKFVNLVPNLQNLVVSYERMHDILDISVEKLNKGASKLKTILPITISNVSFSYKAGREILETVSLEIPKNHRIGLVGRSGSGKTTLLKILFAFIDHTSGEVIYDSRKINQINKKDLRKKIGYVSQVPFFFSGTIFENLSFKSNLTEDEKDEIVNMCKTIGLHDEIMRMPNKYQTLLSENAKNLSGGQKQKLSIVQALLKDPDLLILDEATSNLDPISEYQINEFINKLGEISVLIVSHRLSSVESCDNIYVINNGIIEEKGSHLELLMKKGLYKDLWKKQNIIKKE